MSEMSFAGTSAKSNQGRRGNAMQQLLSTLGKLINGGQSPKVALPYDERPITRPMQLPRERDATRPSHRISDQQWLEIQKAIDQAG